MNSFIERKDYYLEKCFFSFTHPDITLCTHHELKVLYTTKRLFWSTSVRCVQSKSCMKGVSLDQYNKKADT